MPMPIPPPHAKASNEIALRGMMTNPPEKRYVGQRLNRSPSPKRKHSPMPNPHPPSPHVRPPSPHRPPPLVIRPPSPITPSPIHSPGVHHAQNSPMASPHHKPQHHHQQPSPVTPSPHTAVPPSPLRPSPHKKTPQKQQGMTTMQTIMQKFRRKPAERTDHVIPLIPDPVTEGEYETIHPLRPQKKGAPTKKTKQEYTSIQIEEPSKAPSTMVSGATTTMKPLGGKNGQKCLDCLQLTAKRIGKCMWRNKFTLTAVCILFFVLAGIIAVLNIIMKSALVKSLKCLFGWCCPEDCKECT